MIELVAFLGNHGKEYARNRHNVGWMLAEHLTFYHRLNWKRKFKGQYSAMDFGSENTRIHFIKPETYMNLSGTSVREVAAFYKIAPERILIIHDELELPLGTASFKFSGGLGGHNGLRSMKGSLQTADFWRLRIGIGRPTHPDIAAWVLSDFNEEELPILQQVLQSAARALELGLDQGPEKLLPDWSRKKLYFGDSV